MGSKSAKFFGFEDPPFSDTDSTIQKIIDFVSDQLLDPRYWANIHRWTRLRVRSTRASSSRPAMAASCHGSELDGVARRVQQAGMVAQPSDDSTTLWR
jgi:hypothetical protein